MYTLLTLFIIGWSWIFYEAKFKTKTHDPTDDSFLR